MAAEHSTSARQARRYGRLLELQTRLAETTDDLETLLDTVARDVAVLLGDGCLILRIDDEQRLRAASNYHPEPARRQMLRQIAALSEGQASEGLVAEVIRNNRSVLIRDVMTREVRSRLNPLYLPYVDAFGMSSLIEAPMRVRGRTTGAIVFARNIGSPLYDEDDLALAVDVSQRVALALDNAELLARSTREAHGHRSTLAEIGATDARYRELLDLSTIPLAVLTGHEVAYANPAMLRLVAGRQPEDLVGRRLLDMVGEPDRARVAQRADSLARGVLSTSNRQFRLSRLDGSEVVVNSLGSLVTWEGRPGVQLQFEDVTERVRAEAVQLERERFHAEVLDAMPVHALVLNADGRILTTNAGWTQHARRRGLADSLPVSGDFVEICRAVPDAAHGTAVAEGVLSVLQRRTNRFSIDMETAYADGTVHWFTLTAVPMSSGSAQCIVTLNEITERKQFEAELAHQASHDPLTGLPNRLLLQDRLERALTSAPRPSPVVAAVFVDIDHFKLINDSYGHEAGDAVLTAVAQRLTSAVRPSDTVTRFAGDEFVVVCESLDSPAQVMALANRLLRALRGPYLVPGASLEISVSTGIAIAGEGDDAEDLVRNADTAMFEAKTRGRDRVVVFDSALSGRARARLEMTQELRYAVERGELELAYQPVMDLQAGGVAGVEALLRWNRPGHGQLSPQTFIPVAEDSGLIVPIGEWVVAQACTTAADLGARTRTSFSVAVNLSARQLGSPGLVRSITDALDKSGLEPYRLTLELTESVVMDDPVAAGVLLEQLKDLGVRLAIDDFGTGYSSLAYLQRFPVDEVKIDHSFVDGLGTETSDGAIVHGIVSLAHTLDLEVVAEGIETPLQLQRLRELGCERAQGYLIARPLSVGDLDRWLCEQHDVTAGVG